MTRHHASRPGRQAGFTLLEMLVLLVIVSVVTAVALPLVQGPPDRLRVEAATRRLRGAMQTARAVALATNEDQILTVDTATGAFASTATSAPDGIGGVAIDLVVADVERVSPSVGGFRFFADGSSTGGQARLHIGRSSAVVAVDWMTGRIKSREDGDAP